MLGERRASAPPPGEPFYNPYAAVPSMHIGYALIVGVRLLHYGRRRALQVLGALYPLFVLFVVVATGNHFLIDAAAGAIVAVLAASAALLLIKSSAPGRFVRIPGRPLPDLRDELAA